MKKLYIRNISIVVGLFFILNLILFLKGNVIGEMSVDFYQQHALFLDYLKKNFYVSHDLFPQLNMNMGLGQSMVSLYYYGLYNPFLLIIYILPFNNILFNLIGMWFFYFILNSLFMTKLLELNKINRNVNTIVTIIYSFSTSIIFHIAHHPMFIYYLPFLVLSLIGLHYMIDKNKKSIYIIGLSLVFYTNFFFAPIVSVLQFIYFTFLLYESKNVTIKNYFKFFYSYITGVLLGMFILIPSYFFGADSRQNNKINFDYKIFHDVHYSINNLIWSSYCSFFLFFSIFVIIGSFIILKEKKYYILIIPIIAIILINYINLFLNLFQYIHIKIYIFFIPVFSVLLAKILEHKKKIFFVGNITIIISIINIIYFGINNINFKLADRIINAEYVNNLNINILNLKIIILIIFIILFLLILKYRNKKISIIIVIIFVSLNFFNNVNYVSLGKINEFNQGNFEDTYDVNNYRIYSNRLNKIDNYNDHTVPIYTSLENINYINFFKEDIEMEKNSNSRILNNRTFNNLYLKNYLSINKSKNYKGIFYGVDNENICSINDFQELKPLDRTFALNQCLFVNDSTNKYKDSYNIIKLRNDSKKFNISKKETINIPKEYQDGILTINFKVDYKTIDGYEGNITINNHNNIIKYIEKSSNTLYNNEEVTFLIDTKDINKLNIKSTVKTKNKEDLPFYDLKVYYQSIEDFNENLMPTTDIQNLEVDMNNSYDFDINMKDNGYLATTIPYDKGFKIYIDGKEQEVEKMNGRFIGSKITKGNHHVKIDFHIPGFNLGLSLSLIGLLLLIIEIIKDSNILMKIKKIIFRKYL